MSQLKHNKKFYIFLVLIVVLSLPSVYYLFQKGFFQTDDGEWMIIRFSAFYQALRDGQFPVRFLERLNYGYGYPVANFLYPGFMYLAVPFKILGFGFVGSIKIILGLSMIGSGVFTFLWLRRLFDDFSAFIGALVYIYYPYHLYDLYTRGSVGELLALAVTPFIFWQFERRSFFFTSCGIALLILSHNTLAVLFFPLIIAYILIKSSREGKRYLYEYISMLIAALGMAAFFWIPAIGELQYTKFSQIQIAEWQQYFAEFGLLAFGIVIISIALYVLIYNHKKNILNTLFLLTGILSIFLSHEISSFLWNILPVAFVQFPFRFLSLTVVTTAFLITQILSINKRKYFLSCVFIVLLIISALPYLYAEKFIDYPDSYYSTNEATTTVKNEYMPIWVKQEPTKRYTQKTEGTESVKILHASNKITFYPATNEKVIKINTVYYPGWKVYYAKKEIPIQVNDKTGIMEVPIPENASGKIEVVFKETNFRLFANTVSIVTMLAVFIKSSLHFKRKDLKIFRRFFYSFF